MIKPMLCQESPKAFDSPEWIWEKKHDGIRIIARVDASGYRLQARSGADKTRQFPELKLVTRIPALLDGEIVSLDGKFNGVQHRNRESGIQLATDNYPIVYQVFDVLEIDGNSLKNEPLAQRKKLLDLNIVRSDNVQVGEATHDGVALFEEAKANSYEGIVGKRLTSRYQEGARSADWVKVKVWQEGTFLVVGYTPGTGWRSSTFGAMVLSDLQGNYVGQVGTGFNAEDIRHLVTLFVPGKWPSWALKTEPATWVSPFAIRVRFLEKTNDGILRFPSFKGVVKS